MRVAVFATPGGLRARGGRGGRKVEWTVCSIVAMFLLHCSAFPFVCRKYSTTAYLVVESGKSLHEDIDDDLKVDAIYISLFIETVIVLLAIFCC